MLGSLKGQATAHLGERTLIEVGGIGYWVATGSWRPTGVTFCYIHHHVREEASDLYGFEHLAGLELFEKLLAISGIGPKAALAVLSLGTPNRIRSAIHEKDTTFLSSAPGIGAKAAQKIILELHNKIDSLVGLLDDSRPANADLADALVGLGYKQGEIQQALKKMPADLIEMEAQLKWALQQLR